MADRGDITKDRDFPRILAWIDHKLRIAYVSLSAVFIVSLAWTLCASYLLAGFFVGFLSSANLKAVKKLKLDPKLLLQVFLLIVGFQILCGAALYFLRAFSSKKSLDNTDWSKITNSDWYESSGRGSLLEFLYTGHPFVSPYQHFTVAMFGFALMFTGPGIFVHVLIESRQILEMRREAPRRQSAIVLLKLFRQGGVSIAIETFDVDGKPWGEKIIFFAKLQKMRWVYLSENLHEARLETDMDVKIREALGYR
jgi:hypothetical protein